MDDLNLNEIMRTLLITSCFIILGFLIYLLSKPFKK